MFKFSKNNDRNVVEFDITDLSPLMQEIINRLHGDLNRLSGEKLNIIAQALGMDLVSNDPKPYLPPTSPSQYNHAGVPTQKTILKRQEQKKQMNKIKDWEIRNSIP